MSGPDRFICRRCATLVVIGTEETKRSDDVRQQAEAGLCTKHWRERVTAVAIDFAVAIALAFAAPILITMIFLR